ncbi:MAG TPA: SCP2 sterol-binding domain-containing protein [Gaiellaceae bacterium]|jgi:putative sterol carrier protein|nr:SCP2 sterol-binding domain-containing protein [Gaiellaceae bacterium]
MASSAREFFDGLAERIAPERAARLEGSYRFDIEGAGSWRLEADGGRAIVTESDAAADCVIRADEDTFLRAVNREQSPISAYMTRKVRVEGDLGLALRLRDIFS